LQLKKNRSQIEIDVQTPFGDVQYFDLGVTTIDQLTSCVSDWRTQNAGIQYAIINVRQDCKGLVTLIGYGVLDERCAIEKKKDRREFNL
jgi:hypothetical protein